MRPLRDATTPGHVDVLIVGAGLSGIGAACHLQTDAPGTSYAIVEARGASGGTWDLFRFPGVRSDSDMFTLGYPRQGSQAPWRLRQHYFKDAALFRGPIEAKELEFRRAAALTQPVS